MADFKLSAEIEMQAAQALREIDKVVRATKNTKREFNLLGRVVTLDTKRISSSLKNITAVAGIMFAAIAIASPSMRVAFKQMEIAAFLASLAIGEALAPAFEEYLVPAVQKASEWIQNLDSDTQLFMGVMITLGVVVGVVAGIIALLGFELLIVIGIIALVVAALYVLYAAYQDNTLGVRTLVDFLTVYAVPALNEMIDAFNYLWDAIEPIQPLLVALLLLALLPIAIGIAIVVVELTALAYIIGGVINGIRWLINWFVDLGKELGIAKLAFIVFTGGAGAALLVLWELIKEVFSFFGINIVKKIKEAKKKVIDHFKKLGDNIKLVFESIWVWFGDKIDWILGKLEDLVGVIGDAKDLFGDIGGAVSGAVSGITGAIGFQEGGPVERTGLIFAHRGEEVLRGTEARQFREGRGGGTSSRTIINKNTFIIKAVNPKAIAKEIMTMQKISANRRANI